MQMLTDLDQSLVILIFSGLFIILLVLLILNGRQLRKSRKQYTQVINGGSAKNVEEVLIGMQNNINQLIEQNNLQQAELNQSKQYMSKMKSNLDVQRYNAFSEEGGSDLSFSIAILDDEQDGVVLTGIHGRDQTFIYAKPVEKGQSTYNLTPEEKVIIDRIAAKRNA